MKVTSLVKMANEEEALSLWAGNFRPLHAGEVIRRTPVFGSLELENVTCSALQP